MNTSIIVQSNGNYILQNGQILNGNNLITQINMALQTPIGSFMYDTSMGSTLLGYLNNNISIISRNEIIAIIANALIPLVKQGYIQPNPQVVITSLIANKVKLNINVIDNSGQPVKFDWNNYNE